MRDTQAKRVGQTTTSRPALPRKQQPFDVSAKSVLKGKMTVLSCCAHTSSDLRDTHPMSPRYWTEMNIHTYLELIVIHPDSWPGLSLRP